MFILENSLVTSASDLKLAIECEFAFLRVLDFWLGRIDAIPVETDPMLLKSGELGNIHEAKQLEIYRERFGSGVVEIESPERTRAGYRKAAEETLKAFESEADVVFQATFFDESDPAHPFLGYADFVVKQADGSYRIQDTKVARSSKKNMQDQLALYYKQLLRLGVSVDSVVELLLGDGTIAQHYAVELIPPMEVRLSRMRALIAEHTADTGAVAWDDDRYRACCKPGCVHCEPERQAANDVTLVAGLGGAMRGKFRVVGIRTVEDLANAPAQLTVPGVKPERLAVFQHQARLQHEAALNPGKLPPVEIINRSAITNLPTPNPGDLFFDFEGDPMSSEESENGIQWDLDYLWGVVDSIENYTAFWAHSLEEEAQAFKDFMAMISARLADYPDMHIYHYANYEITHLKKIAKRHGIGEERVEELISAGVFVDLLITVRAGLRIGYGSYSLKKVEHLYMGAELRDGEGVTSSVGSIQEYWGARELIQAGRLSEAQPILDRIADYNKYDCVSTLRLRGWLLGLVH